MDPKSWERVVRLAHRKEIQEGKTYHLTFYPIVTALLACLRGIPEEKHLDLQDILAAQVERGNSEKEDKTMHASHQATLESRGKQELEKPQEFRDKEDENHPQPQPSQLYPVLPSCGQSVTSPSNDSKDSPWVTEESVSAPPAYSNSSSWGPHFNDLCQTKDHNWGTPL